VNKVKAVRCDIYSRIVGYYTATNVWNLGKKAEFKERQVLSNMDIERAVNREQEQK
jgi:anaerobic ribonucleoside-triphosphate reductase